MCREVSIGKRRGLLAHFNLIPEIQPRDMEQDRCLVPTVAKVMDVSGGGGGRLVCAWMVLEVTKSPVTLGRS